MLTRQLTCFAQRVLGFVAYVHLWMGREPADSDGWSEGNCSRPEQRDMLFCLGSVALATSLAVAREGGRRYQEPRSGTWHGL